MSPRPITIETSVHELSPGGDGVAIHEIEGERRAIFVPGTAPNERVRVEVDLTRRPARGRLLSVLEPSPSRVTPPCKHVERCGGCDWMFLEPSAQAREHAAMVARLLGIGLERVTSHPAIRELAYRTRARVHLEGKRGRVVVGMFGRRSHEPAAVDTCVVLDPILDRARAQLAVWLEGANGRGEAQLALGRATADETKRLPVLDLRFNGELPATVYGRLERALGVDLAGARILSGAGESTRSRGRSSALPASRELGTGVPAIIGDPMPFIVGADDQPLQLAPGGFSQATEAGNRILAERVAEVAASLPPGPCVELYAGAGNFTVLLARERDVVAVESDHAACLAARENLALRGLSRNAKHEAKIIEADASTFAIPKNTKLVVLDPPREGARSICEALALAPRGRGAPAIVYVACDPPTLARDVKTLGAAGWEVRTAETFEMFPQTSHVETLVVLERAARGQ